MLVVFAARAQLFDEGFALRQRLAEEVLLPGWVVHLAAVVLIGGIVGAQGVAVGEQRRCAVQVDQRGVGQKRGVARRCQFLRHQEIAVAVHEEQLCAARRKGGAGMGDVLVEGGVEVIVPGPVFEQVAQHIQRVCTGRRVLHEVQEYLRAARLLRAQVQVGNEQSVGHGCN